MSGCCERSARQQCQAFASVHDIIPMKMSWFPVNPILRQAKAPAKIEPGPLNTHVSQYGFNRDTVV
jgi:hypothetical protein